jgi:hypothetical protein
VAELSPPRTDDDEGTAPTVPDLKEHLLSGPRSDDLVIDRPVDRGREVDLSG